MVWTTFLDNRDALRFHDHISFKLAPTVSILSIFHLPDLFQWAVEHQIISPEDFYVNMVDRPFYYNVKAFKAPQKKKIIQRYQLFFDWCRDEDMPLPVIESFQSCLDFMTSEDLSQYWDSFLKETEVINTLRNEKLMASWYQDLGLIE